MKIWKLEGDDLATVVGHVDPELYCVRVFVDDDELKFKFNEGMWTTGLGVIEGRATTIADDVLAQCQAEAERTLQAQMDDPDGSYNGADVAADIVRKLVSAYGLPMPQAEPEVLYEKCDHCHLFISPNPSHGMEPTAGYAEYIHHHRGDAVDERLDADHEARPSGRKANLLAWKTYGPVAMRERFVS